MSYKEFREKSVDNRGGGTDEPSKSNINLGIIVFPPSVAWENRRTIIHLTRIRNKRNRRSYRIRMQKLEGRSIARKKILMVKL